MGGSPMTNPISITTAADTAVATLIEAHDDLRTAARKVIDTLTEKENRHGVDELIADADAIRLLEDCL